MNTQKVATKLQGNKVANSKATKVTLNTVKQASAKQETKQPNEYQTKVLKRCANLREEKGKIGYCLSFLKAQSEVLSLTANELKHINNWKKDASELNANLKANKAGKYSAWQIFQYLYKISK
jgi:hypothetical protein